MSSKLEPMSSAPREGEEASSTKNSTGTPVPKQVRAKSTLPTILSTTSKKSKEMYSLNYVLDVDTFPISARQHSVRVGNYYKRLIN